MVLERVRPASTVLCCRYGTVGAGENEGQTTKTRIHTAYQLFVLHDVTDMTTGNTNISAHEYLSSNISGNL